MYYNQEKSHYFNRSHNKESGKVIKDGWNEKDDRLLILKGRGREGKRMGSIKKPILQQSCLKEKSHRNLYQQEEEWDSEKQLPV